MGKTISNELFSGAANNQEPFGAKKIAYTEEGKEVFKRRMGSLDMNDYMG